MISEKHIPITTTSANNSPLTRLKAAFERSFGSLESHLDNPFAMRGFRIDSRRRRPALTLLFPALLTLAAYAFLCWLFGPGQNRSTGVPGISLGRMLVMASGCIYGYAATIACGCRAADVLRLEVNRNTLSQILMLPMRRPELLLRLAAFPFLAGMLVMLSGLPFFLLALCTGGISIFELASFYLFMAIVCFRPPSPSQLEALAEAMGPGGAVPIGKKKAQASWTNYWFIFWVFGRGLGHRFSWIFSKALSVLVGATASWFAFFGVPVSYFGVFLWPVLLGMALIHPLAFYAVRLPPIVLLLPLFLGSIALRLLQPQTELQESQAYVRARALLRFARNLAILGYFWPTAIAGGGLSWLISDSSQGIAESQAGLLLLLLGYAIIASFFRVQSVSLSLDEDHGTIQERRRSPIWFAAPFITVSLLYLPAHLLGWTMPFPAPALGLVKRMAVIAAAMIPLGLGLKSLSRAVMIRRYEAYLGRLQREKSATVSPSTTTKTGVPMDASGAATARSAVVFGFWVVLFLYLLPFPVLLSSDEMIRRAAAVSPFASMLALSPAARHIISGISSRLYDLPPWWMGAVVQPALGIVLWAVATLIGAGSSKPVAHTSVVQPTRASRKDNSWLSRRVAEVIQRIDNPIVVRRLRLAARNGSLATAIGAGLLPYAMLIVIWTVPAVAGTLAEMGRNFLAAYQYNMGAAVYLGILSVFLVLVFLLWLLGMPIGIHALIKKETERSTFPFLLMTPLSDRELAAGIILDTAAMLGIVTILAIPAILLFWLLAAVYGGGSPATVMVLHFGLVTPVAALAAIALSVATNLRFRVADSAALYALAFVILSAVYMGGWYLSRPESFVWSRAYPVLFCGILFCLFRPLASRALRRRRNLDLETEGQHFDN